MLYKFYRIERTLVICSLFYCSLPYPQRASTIFYAFFIDPYNNFPFSYKILRLKHSLANKGSNWADRGLLTD